MVPPRRTPFRGRPRGRLRGRENGTRTAGGVSQEQPGGVSHPPRPLFAVVVRRFVLRPADPNRASGEGKDGSDPPFCAAGAARRRVGVRHGVRHRVRPPPRLRGGRSRLYVSLREGSSARTRAGRSAATRGPMLDRFIRGFLVVGSVSVGCAWTWPGAFPQADPLALLVRYHTPNVYTFRRRVVLHGAGRGRVPGWPVSSRLITDLVRPDGR